STPVLSQSDGRWCDDIRQGEGENARRGRGQRRILSPPDCAGSSGPSRIRLGQDPRHDRARFAWRCDRVGGEPAGGGGESMVIQASAWRSGRAGAPSVTALLACGAVAGPLFVSAFLVQGAIRPEYNPLRHSISTLALGSEFGWIQSLNFLVAGLL